MMKVVCALVVLFGIFHASQCRAKSVEDINPLIVGGHPADIANFPYHLALIHIVGGYLCGASNIHQRYALTAARCIFNPLPSEAINLIGGSTSRLTGHVTFFIESYSLHPSFSMATGNNDVGLIRVHAATPLIGHPNVSPITLHGNCAAACCGVCVDGPPVTIVGWGFDESGNSPENLLQIQKTINDQTTCTNSLGGPITESQFCTVVANGIDSCTGDTGGAVVRSGMIVGVVGVPGCAWGTQTAYARIEAPIIRDWIRSVVGV